MVITQTSDGLTMIMHCDASPGLSVGRAHEASTRIEDEVYRHRAADRVTVHFEPTDRPHTRNRPAG